jgi:hypothetical protein
MKDLTRASGFEIALDAEPLEYDPPTAEIDAMGTPQPAPEPMRFSDADCFRLHGMGCSGDDDNRPQ